MTRDELLDALAIERFGPVDREHVDTRPAPMCAPILLEETDGPGAQVIRLADWRRAA